MPSPRLSMIEGITCYPVLKKDNNQDQPALRCVKYSNLPKPERGIVLIYGPNGSGKTSIAMSLLRAPPTDFGAVAFSTFYGTPKWPHPIFTASLDTCLRTLSVTLKRLIESEYPKIVDYYIRWLDLVPKITSDKSFVVCSELLGKLKDLFDKQENGKNVFLAGAQECIYYQYGGRSIVGSKKEYDWNLYSSMSGDVALDNYLFRIETNNNRERLELLWATQALSSRTLCCYVRADDELFLPATFYFHPHMATMRDPTRSLMLMLKYFNQDKDQIVLDENSFHEAMRTCIKDLFNLFGTDRIEIVFKKEFKNAEYEFFIGIGDVLVPIWMLGEGQRVVISFVLLIYIVNKYIEMLKNGKICETSCRARCGDIKGEVIAVFDSLEAYADPITLEKMLRIIANLLDVARVENINIAVYIASQSIDVARLLVKHLKVEQEGKYITNFFLVQAFRSREYKDSNEEIYIDEVNLVTLDLDELFNVLIDRLDPRKIPLGKY